MEDARVHNGRQVKYVVLSVVELAGHRAIKIAALLPELARAVDPPRQFGADGDAIRIEAAVAAGQGAVGASLGTKGRQRTFRTTENMPRPK